MGALFPFSLQFLPRFRSPSYNWVKELVVESRRSYTRRSAGYVVICAGCSSIDKIAFKKKLKNGLRTGMLMIQLTLFPFLKERLDIFIQEGSKFGYFPEPNKSYIVVNPDFIDEATTEFGEMGIQIVTGRKFLGGFIGGSEDVIAWMEEKVKGWVSSV